MAEPLDNVAYLAQTVGPRPAGTEEEQQAALYITEQLQNDAGMAAVIEDFNCNPDHDLPRVVLCVVALLASLSAMFVQVMVIPTLIITLLCTVLYVTESMGKTKLSRLLGSGVSQNVVAKYVPAPIEDAPAPRRRKVILVAHYDSERTRKDLSGALLEKAEIMRRIAFVGLFALPVIMLVRAVMTFGGTTLIAVNVLTALAMICAALPIVRFALNRSTAYNEAANCNAAGVAVLMEVAKRIGYAGIYAPTREYERESFEPEIHGEREARESGLIPEEVELVYDVAPISEVPDPDLPEDSPAARLLAAKAAVAALTGKPVSKSLNISFDQEETEPATDFVEGDFSDGVEESEGGISRGEQAVPNTDEGPFMEAANVAEASAALEEEAAEVSEAPAAAEAKKDVPEWFRKAQEKAKKPAVEASPAYRSRFADALDAANRESMARAQAASEEANRAAISETEARLQRMRESIMEVRPPRVGGAVAAAAGDAAFAAADVAAGAAEKVTESTAGAAAAGAVAADVVETVAPAVTKPAVPEVFPVTPAAEVTEVLSAGSSTPKKPSMRKKRAIALPSIGKAPGKEEASTEDGAAAESQASGKTSAVRSLRAKLPAIGGVAGSAEKNGEEEGKASRKAAKLAGLPSIGLEKPAQLAGEQLDPLTPAASAQVVSNAPENPEEDYLWRLTGGVSSTGAADEDLGSTQAFQPYDLADMHERAYGGKPAEGLVEAPSPVDFVEEDLDAAEELAQAGCEASSARPGYAKMPKSRIQGFLGRFSKSSERRSVRDEHSTPQEWLDVDKDFDARSAGAARGGWESFRQDQDGFAFDGGSEARRYEGEIDMAFSDDADVFSGRGGRRKRRWEGGAVSRDQLGRVSMLSGEEDADEYPVGARAHEENVYRFRHPDIDVEVWFVALGSELTSNGGMEAFMNEHASDLRGAVIVELEGLGAGELSLVEKEGLPKALATSSRMRRYATKASAEFGIPLGRIDISWRETSSAYAMRRGYQALHLVGALDGKPARYGQADDVLDYVDEETLMRNADFVMELLKQI